jgi:transposase
MPKAYSRDMRQRVIAEVESGASRRAAAEEFAVSASTAIIWVKCFRETGRCAAKPRGGSISPLEEYADFLLGLIEKQSDLTLDEVVAVVRKHKIPDREEVLGPRRTASRPHSQAQRYRRD